MQALTATELLAAWEGGLRQGPVERALTLLAAASPEASAQSLAMLSIGERDARLLALRERAYGPMLVGLSSCPECGERVELRLRAEDARLSSDRTRQDPISLSVRGYELRFRLPNSNDLMAVAEAGGVGDARSQLLQRCILTAQHEGQPAPVVELPADVVDSVVEAMERADPQASRTIELACPTCNHEWQEIFDIAAFIWAEIDVWARRVLGEVHALASVYGWKEADILAMTPWRRQCYLDLIAS